jgi:hypothetical protein
LTLRNSAASEQEKAMTLRSTTMPQMAARQDGPLLPFSIARAQSPPNPTNNSALGCLLLLYRWKH